MSKMRFFRGATKIRIFRNDRSCTVWASNPALVEDLKDTLKKTGYECRTTTDRNTILVINTERYLPASFFITEVREALKAAGFMSRPEWGSARCDQPELNGAFSNVVRSLEITKTAIACA